MIPPLHRLVRAFYNERGFAAAEMGVLLAVPAVGAAVFGGAMLKSMTSANQQLQSTVDAAMLQSGGGIASRGGLLARTDGASVTQVLVEVMPAGARPVDLDPTAASGRTVVTYVDATSIVHDVPWHVIWIGGSSGDQSLDPGEAASLEIDLSGVHTAATFTLEVRPAQGAWITLHVTRPSGAPLDPVIQLQ